MTKKSSSKCKTTWDIIKKVTNNQHTLTDIQELTIDSEQPKDQQDIVEAFNHYFSTIVDKTSKNDAKNKTNHEKVPTFHYYLEQLCSSSPIFSYQDIFNQGNHFNN